MLSRLVPHPVLSTTLMVVWLGLVNKITPGNLLLGAALGVIVPLVTAAYWPDRPTLRRPLAAAEYVIVVLWDIAVANVLVASIILFKPNAAIRSCWITVPLDLTSPEAITVLAGTITLTPGTVSTTLAADAGSLLVHCLHAQDPGAVRDTIKARYESRLMEVFQ